MYSESNQTEAEKIIKELAANELKTPDWLTAKFPSFCSHYRAGMPGSFPVLDLCRCLFTGFGAARNTDSHLPFAGLLAITAPGDIGYAIAPAQLSPWHVLPASPNLQFAATVLPVTQQKKTHNVDGFENDEYKLLFSNLALYKREFEFHVYAKKQNRDLDIAEPIALIKLHGHKYKNGYVQLRRSTMMFNSDVQLRVFRLKSSNDIHVQQSTLMTNDISI